MVLNTEQNSLYLADCLDLLKEWHKNGRRKFIDLVYIDPPFNSNRNYNVIFGSEFDLSEEAFKDTWSSISYLDELEDINAISPRLFNFLKMLENTGLPKSYISYLTKMSIRCWFMREMLKDTGSFYFHCDPTMSHYIKAILDYIFDIENFRNEICWLRTSNTGSNKARAGYFGKNHDTIFWYTKGSIYKFNRDSVIEPFSEDELKRYKHNDNDGKGPYYWNTLSHHNQFEKYAEEGRAEWKEGRKHPRYKQYLNDTQGGKLLGDLWSDMPIMGGPSKERLGYPTQKPEKLLERIILASSNENDVVADFFLGGGTTISVADRLNRKWLGIDINLRAIQLTQGRLEKVKKIVKKDYIIEGIPNSARALRAMVDQKILGEEKDSRFALEDITVKYYLHGVVGNESKRGDDSIDGYFGFEYKGKQMTGLVQVTSGAGKNHLKSFCSEVGLGTGSMGVYISFKDRIPKSWYIKAKQYGKIGNVDKIQILTFEDLIDNKQQFQKPSEVLTL